jgi:alkylated DNA nucleotide flippase Atl1
MIEDEGTDILCIQEPYTIGSKLVGLPRSYKALAAGKGRKRAAIIINNKNIDTILINQLSDEDAVVMEAKVDNVTLIIASMYFDINRPIETDLKKMEATTTHAKGVGIIFAIDSNSRSTSWHDMLTNKRGKITEEFLLSKQLHIVNEESCCTTFWTSRSASNIDLTVTNNQVLNIIGDWAIDDQESCSDHRILKFGLGNDTFQPTGLNSEGVRYKAMQRDIGKFQEKFCLIMEQKMSRANNRGGEAEELDRTLCRRVATAPSMEEVVEELHDALESACRSSIKLLGTTKKTPSYKSVPWWTDIRTIMRKKVNAQRQKYQQTRGSIALHDQQKGQYLASKAEYAATIRKERSASWKEFCNLTSSTNP